MTDIARAIVNRYEMDGALTSNTNGIWLQGAPQETPYPFVELFMISTQPNKTMQQTNDLEQQRWQFSIWSRNRSAVEVMTLFDMLRAQFDDCALSIAGWKSVSMTRMQGSLDRDDDNDVWRYWTDYMVEAQEA